MSVITNHKRQISTALPWFASSARGWIGIDIGTRSIKLAQVERRFDQFHIVNRWVVTQDDEPISEAALSQGFLASNALRLVDLRRLFSRSETAASISMSFQTLRSLDLPEATPEEMRAMVREELTADSNQLDDDYVFDYWTRNGGKNEALHVTALSMPTSLAARVAEDLLRCGFECQILDGLPVALARAVAMANGDSNAPVAVVDLGDSEFTFVLAAAGKPLFTRVLRDGGLRSMMQSLRTALNLSHEQAMQLLIRHAVTGGEDSRCGMASGPTQLLDQPLAMLVCELQRTLAYLAQQLPTFKPNELVLFGGGACIRNLPTYLRTRLGLPTEVWQLPSSSPQTAADDALFGVAAALSTLRWE